MQRAITGRASRGFTLIEALVALLALSIGLLGVAALQMTGLRQNLSASWRSQATYLSYDIIDRIRANRTNRAQYAIGLGAAPTGTATSAIDLAAWKANLANTLPDGNGQVRFVTPTVVEVSVQWDNDKANEGVPDAGVRHEDAAVSRADMTRRQQGFSLVELMVAMGLSLVLLAGALSILYSSKMANAENERIARVQESGRTVVELILRDARAAGFIGCSRPIDPGYFWNGLVNPTGLLWRMNVPMQGYEAGASAWTPTLPAEVVGATAGSDVLVLRTAREGMPVFRLNAPLLNPTSPLSVSRAANETVPSNTTMVVGDCSGASAFNVSAFTPGSATTATLDHAANATEGRNVNTSVGRSYKSGALVTPVDTVIYYVAAGENGPALWRRVGMGVNVQTLALVEGVENLQIQYGVDTNGDQLADAYQTANTVDAANRWDSVVSLSISVLIRSETETNFERDNRTFNLQDTTFTAPNDRRQRSVFTTTVTLRNRTT